MIVIMIFLKTEKEVQKINTLSERSGHGTEAAITAVSKSISCVVMILAASLSSSSTVGC